MKEIYRFKIEIEYPYLDQDAAQRAIEKLLISNFEGVKIEPCKRDEKQLSLFDGEKFEYVESQSFADEKIKLAEELMKDLS